MNTELAGYYKITATNKDTLEERVLADWFPNLITNNGLNLINVGSGNMTRYCYVGSGSTAPTVNDSGLQNKVATKEGELYLSSYSAKTTEPYYGYATRSWTFAPGEVLGNLSEVGCGKDALGVNIFSRSLITDALGNPITITVLADDYLTVIYELRCYPPLTDSVSTVNIAGVETECTVRAADVVLGYRWGFYLAGNYDTAAYGYYTVVTVHNGVLGNITGSPTLSLGAVEQSAPTDVYTQGSYFRDGVVNLSLTQGNSAEGISAILIPTWLGSFQIGFNPPIVKDNTRTLRLTYRVSWGRKEIV